MMCCLLLLWPYCDLDFHCNDFHLVCGRSVFMVFDCGNAVILSFIIVKKSEFFLEDSEGWEAMNLGSLPSSSTSSPSQRALSLLLCSV